MLQHLLDKSEDKRIKIKNFMDILLKTVND